MPIHLHRPDPRVWLRPANLNLPQPVILPVPEIESTSIPDIVEPIARWGLEPVGWSDLSIGLKMAYNGCVKALVGSSYNLFQLLPFGRTGSASTRGPTLHGENEGILQVQDPKNANSGAYDEREGSI